MFPLILGILICIFTILSSFFISVSNFQSLIEDDFMGRAQDNAVVHSMQVGQLYYRAQILSPTSKKASVADRAIREDNNKPFNNVTYLITYNDTSANLNTEVKIK